MHSTTFTNLLLTLLTIFSSSTALAQSLPFKFTYIFSATLNLGPAASFTGVNTTRITTQDGGGIIIPEPILNGTVAGPAINGTITSGLAFPVVYQSGGSQVQAPLIEAYGITSDGVGFYIRETGVGGPQAQITRIELSIGGGAEYAALRDGFILTSVNPSADRTKVAVKGYLVENTATG